MRAGFIGIISNLSLTLLKIYVGLISKSQAILADGINSFSDTLSSIITSVGFYIAGKPADKDHPFGHERSEYIAGFSVAMITLYLGITIGLESIQSILKGLQPIWNIWTIYVLILSVVIKIWLSVYYAKASKKINSAMLLASSQDSKNDVLMSSSILIAMLTSRFLNINIDGILGFLIALYIIWNAIKMVKEFINELIGNRPSDELLVNIKDILENNDSIFGYHDLLVHTYGGDSIYGTVHVELDQNMSLIKAHDIVDRLEKEILKKTSVSIVAHADPLDLDNIELHTTFQLIKRYLKSNYPQASFHDLRLIHNTLYFDIVLNGLKCEDDITLGIAELLVANKIMYPVKITFDTHQFI